MPKKPKVNPVVVTIRGRTAWKNWLSKLARGLGTTESKVIDRALEAFAKKISYEPPPKRT